jgi:hypothetical protein
MILVKGEIHVERETLGQAPLALNRRIVGGIERTITTTILERHSLKYHHEARGRWSRGQVLEGRRRGLFLFIVQVQAQLWGGRCIFCRPQCLQSTRWCCCCCCCCNNKVYLQVEAKFRVAREGRKQWRVLETQSAEERGQGHILLLL